MNSNTLISIARTYPISKHPILWNLCSCILQTISCVFYTNEWPHWKVINERCLERVLSDFTVLRPGEELKHLSQNSPPKGVNLDLKVNGKLLALCNHSDNVLLSERIFWGLRFLKRQCGNAQMIWSRVGRYSKTFILFIYLFIRGKHCLFCQFCLMSYSRYDS